MRDPRPIRVLVWGAGREWFARVLKIKAPRSDRWIKPPPEDRKEHSSTGPREALRKAITALGKEHRTCAKCGAVWHYKRTRTIRICPTCQSAQYRRGLEVPREEIH